MKKFAIFLFALMMLTAAPVLGQQTYTGIFYPVDAGSIASASTVNLCALHGNSATITGTTSITALGTCPAGATYQLRFSGIVLLTYNGTTLIIPGSANWTTAAGDTYRFTSLGGGNWFMSAYTLANGQAIASSGGGGSAIIITDGVTTVNPASTLTFSSGATVTDGGSGNAQVAVTGGGGATFNGAMVHLTGDKTLTGSDLIVPWDAADYDTDSWWSSGAATCLTVPSGVTKVRLSGTFKVQSAVATTDGGISWRKGGTSFIGYSGFLTKIALENWFLTVTSPVFAVTAGDCLTMIISMDSGTVKSGIETSFSVQAVP